MNVNGVPVLLEAKRGCGYRAAGGLYLISGELSAPCCLLPAECSSCPCCGTGLPAKFSRGWTWIDPAPFLNARPRPCAADPGLYPQPCPVARMAAGEIGRCGLLWIGKQFYATPDDFMAEAAAQGISRRLAAGPDGLSLPRGFVLGETWVLCAHIEGLRDRAVAAELDAARARLAEAQLTNGDAQAAKAAIDELAARERRPAIICAFLPHRIERVITRAEAEAGYIYLKNGERLSLEELRARGIEPVVVERAEDAPTP